MIQAIGKYIGGTDNLIHNKNKTDKVVVISHYNKQATEALPTIVAYQPKISA